MKYSDMILWEMQKQPRCLLHGEVNIKKQCKKNNIFVFLTETPKEQLEKACDACSVFWAINNLNTSKSCFHTKGGILNIVELIFHVWSGQLLQTSPLLVI